MQPSKSGISLHLRSSPCLHSNGRISKTEGDCSSAWQGDTGFPAPLWACKTMGYLWELPAGPLSLLGSVLSDNFSVLSVKEQTPPLLHISSALLLGRDAGPGLRYSAGK